MNPIIKNISSFEKVFQKFQSSPVLSVQGLWDASKGALVAYLREKVSRPILVITPGPSEAERFFCDLKFFCGSEGYLFPAWETLPHEKIPPHVEIVGERFSVLEGLSEKNKNLWVVAPLQALIHHILEPQVLKELTLSLSQGSTFPFRSLIESLDRLGFKRQAVVENKCEFSVRGGLIDVFSPQSDEPVRLEFEGDKIISLRLFDSQTQMSHQSIHHVKIFPACELEFMGKDFAGTSFLSYLPKDFLLVWDDFQEVTRTFDALFEKIPDAHEGYLPLEDLKASMMIDLSDVRGSAMGPLLSLSVQRSNVWQSVQRNLDSPLGYASDIFKKIGEKTKEGFTTHFVAQRPAEGERWKEIMQEKNIWDKRLHHVSVGSLSRGFIFPEEKIAVLTDEDIFGRLQIRSLPRRSKRGLPIQDAADLSAGDYVVHLSYGIGKFLGVNILNDRGVKGEFLTIEYDGGAKLYVPIDQMDLVERFIGIRGRAPKLNRLGGKDWERAKKKAELALRDFAAELLDIQAKREALGGHAFAGDTQWQKEFEDSFPFKETVDQWDAIQDVKKDLESSKPMDRLICGDVGYGKTEVAIRAAFKVVMEGKQVAILVPTTVLAQQHFYTFRERFSGYPIEVEMLSRFRTESEQKKILQKIKEGKVDVVIGTHRLLAQDMGFKDLGLVVIDEEQRFGVAHKEKLKKMRASVDVLTLSATPIPRTLYLSLMQAKDMSLIHTAPENRFPIETFLTPFDERLIRDAIVREISRDGQVFYIHNRVGSIHRMKEKLKRLVPQATFAVGHGQMPEDELSEVMRAFIEGKVQVLVATNIVESGLDIPNANTILIDHADRFGLADLYQLRGRVGRSRRRAYAYLIYSPDRLLNAEAKLRLKTIEDFTDLGSGFKVAMRDLEIRGAGNILGKEQHGHIMAIGFQLYCRLLDEGIRRLQGETVVERKPVSLQLGFDWAIPQNYIENAALRMEMYRKIFDLKDDDIQKIVRELMDRFGPIPKDMILLLEVAQLKALARKKDVTSIQIYKNKVYFRSGEVIWLITECHQGMDQLGLVKHLRNILKEKNSYDKVKPKRVGLRVKPFKTAC